MRCSATATSWARPTPPTPPKARFARPLPKASKRTPSTARTRTKMRRSKSPISSSPKKSSAEQKNRKKAAGAIRRPFCCSKQRAQRREQVAPDPPRSPDPHQRSGGHRVRIGAIRLLPRAHLLGKGGVGEEDIILEIPR